MVPAELLGTLGPGVVDGDCSPHVVGLLARVLELDEEVLNLLESGRSDVAKLALLIKANSESEVVRSASPKELEVLSSEGGAIVSDEVQNIFPHSFECVCSLHVATSSES